MLKPSVLSLIVSIALACAAVSSAADLPDDLTVWPNKVSFRNSDPWLVENHDKIRKMRPRVIVLNFANDASTDHVQNHTRQLIKALAEATRYHGYKDPNAPAFLEYEIVKFIDFRDASPPPERTNRNSEKFPKLANPPKDFFCDYAAFYTDEFAKHYGFPDPNRPNRFLNLHELINAGIVHELWFYAVHVYEEGWPAFELIELKQYYDEQCRPIAGKYGPAGNGHHDLFPWSGRTFRMAFFNPHRGIGCAMENFGHGLEGYANHNAIGYYRKYFREFAELDLDKRYGLPFRSLYTIGNGDKVEYPTATSIKITRKGTERVIDPYIAFGGNVHFPPGGRKHYDLSSPFTVKSTIENYRLHNGADGKDAVTDFNKEKLALYKNVAPDCMGPWMVFWRQSMPGLDNMCVDDDGRPMKNWWPFLFY